jgi:uncharacterized protein YndB with AHSA1/START domain
MLHDVELVSDRRWCFGAPQEAVWAALAATEDYTTWWPWLTAFEATGLVAGARWRCAVRPPLRYSVRFAIEIVDVGRPSFVTARVSGDIAGRARVDVAEEGDGSSVRLTSALAPTRRTVALLTALAGPIARRSHDWVLDTGARQFAAHVTGPA